MLCPSSNRFSGAAVRIVGLAEKMDNDREALRALGASSLQLARQVTAVMAGKTPNGGIQASLERILKALDDIEKFMKELAARNRLRRFVSYAFSVPQHVKRLSGELADAVRDLTVVALLDVDKQLHATRSAVEDNAGFDGEFRLLRHCEVQKLERVFDWEDREEEMAILRYHRAQVDGQLLVVRSFEGSTLHHSLSGQEPDETMFNRIAYHDRILEEISTVQRSHPNVARIYGWGRGSVRSRFTVFKSGYQPVWRALRNSPNPLITGIRCVFKLLDAVQHLKLMGISWSPNLNYYALDEQLQPIIGLQNDLGQIDLEVDQLFDAHNQILYMTLPFWSYGEWQSVPAAHLQEIRPTALPADLIGQMETLQRERYVISKAEFSGRSILSDTAAEGLRSISEDETFDDGLLNDSRMWANILLALDKNRGHRVMRSLRVVYLAYGYQTDCIRLYRMDQDSEHLVHDTYTFDVPHEQQDEVRAMFGISAPSWVKVRTSDVIATGPYISYVLGLIRLLM